MTTQINTLFLRIEQSCIYHCKFIDDLFTILLQRVLMVFGIKQPPTASTGSTPKSSFPIILAGNVGKEKKYKKRQLPSETEEDVEQSTDSDLSNDESSSPESGNEKNLEIESGEEEEEGEEGEEGEGEEEEEEEEEKDFTKRPAKKRKKENASKPHAVRLKPEPKKSRFEPISVKKAEIIAEAEKRAASKLGKKTKKAPTPEKTEKKKLSVVPKKPKRQINIKAGTLKKIVSITDNLVKVKNELTLLQNE